MTVGDLITRLQQFDPALPVYLADWMYEENQFVIRDVSLGSGEHWLHTKNTESLEHGQFVQISGD